MKPIIKKVLVLKGQDYYAQHLSILNGIFPVKLAPKEIKVLACFMSLDKSITEDDKFNTLARKKVRDKEKVSPGGLGNYFNSMIKKGFLFKSPITGRITINPLIEVNSSEQYYQFKITNEDNQ